MRLPGFQKMAGTETTSYFPLVCIDDINTGHKMDREPFIEYYEMYLSHLRDVLM